MNVAVAALNETDFRRQIIRLAKLLGWRTAGFRAAMNRRGQWSTAGDGDYVGWPDLILVKDGVMLALELKVGKRQATPAQKAWLAALNGVPGVYATELRPADWDWLCARLRGENLTAGPLMG